MASTIRSMVLSACALTLSVMAGAAGQVEDAAALVQEGRKLTRAGKHDEALALYRRALKAEPQSYDAHLAAGIVLDLKGDYATARTHLQRAIDLAPAEGRPQALAAMAVSYAFERKAEEAARYYRQQFDLQIGEQRLDSAAATANAVARVYLESGDSASAERWYEAGYDTARKLTDLPPDQVDLWLLRWHHARSRIAARRGDRAEAGRHAEAVREIVAKGGLNAQQWPAYQYLIGYNALHAGDFETAVAELLKADQEDPFILGLLAQAYEKKGDAAKAREYYERVMQSNAHSLQNAFSRPLAREKLAAR